MLIEYLAQRFTNLAAHHNYLRDLKNCRGLPPYPKPIDSAPTYSDASTITHVNLMCIWSKETLKSMPSTVCQELGVKREVWRLVGESQKQWLWKSTCNKYTLEFSDSNNHRATWKLKGGVPTLTENCWIVWVEDADKWGRCVLNIMRYLIRQRG